MVKLVSPSGWDFGEPNAVSVRVLTDGRIGPNDRREFVKRAGDASAVFLPRLKDLKIAADEEPVHLISHGASEYWGCFATGTPIALDDGCYAAIETIEVGDPVLSAEGNICPVAHTFKRRVARGTRVRVGGLLDDLLVSNDHPFRVASREQFVCDHDAYKRCLPPTQGQQNICNRTKTIRQCVIEPYREIAVEWGTADALREGDFLVWTAPTLKPVMEIGVDEGYLIGAWLAEGYFIRNGSNGAVSSLQLTIGLHEERFDLRLWTAAVRCGFHPASYDRPEHSTITVGITGAPARFRQYHAEFREHASMKRLPPWACCLPRETRLAIVAGYFDGDGSYQVSAKENRATARTTSRDLALGMQRLCWSLGFPAVVCRVQPATADINASYNVSVAHSYLGDLVPYSWKIKTRPLDQTTKVHGFWARGRMYLPVREAVPVSEPFDVYNFEVEGDHTYSGPNVDSHNCNRNGDGFKEAACTTYVDTFEKFARYFRNHRNQNPADSYGVPKLAAYNPAMHRVELLILLNKTKAAAERNGGHVADQELEKLARGADIPVSMACRVAYDSCTWCQNKARTRADYCTAATCKAGGCKDNLTRLVKVGSVLHHLGVDNPHPCWFDISGVFRPADRTAYGHRADYLTKAAADAGFFGADGAALADDLAVPLGVILFQEGAAALTPGVAAERMKLALALDAARSLPALLPPPETRRAFAMDVQPPIDFTRLDAVAPEKTAAALGALADLRIVLSLRDYARLTKRAALIGDAAPRVPGAIGRMVADGTLERQLRDGGVDAEKAASAAQRREAGRLYGGYSLAGPAVADRCLRSSLRGHVAPPAVAPPAEKRAALDAPAEALARDYAAYKVAALHRIAGFDPGFDDTIRFALVQDQVA